MRGVAESLGSMWIKPCTAGRFLPAGTQPFLRTPSYILSAMRGPRRAPGPAPPAATSPDSAAASTAPPSREDHNAFQAQYFARELPALQASITPEVEKQLARVAAAVPGLGPNSRVLDAGAGDGALIPHLQALGVRDILAVDVCPEMIDALKQRMAAAGAGGAPPLGNTPAVRTWTGDVVDLPSYMGPFDAVFFNSVFGNLHDQRAALLRAALLLRPGGWLVISHPLGRTWLEGYAAANPQVVPHSLPTRDELEAMTVDLPLTLVTFRDELRMYLARLKVPEGYAAAAAPVRMQGRVVAGFGRGSKQLGVPTANLSPEDVAEELTDLPPGVYFGWARLEAPSGSPPEDFKVHKMVMNVGKRPTFDDGTEAEASVEVHIMHRFSVEDFHGAQLRVTALGFLRPEIKFSGIQALLERIRTDIGLASAQLDTPTWRPFTDDAFLNDKF